LRVVNKVRNSNILIPNTKPFIFFMTDGHDNGGSANTPNILNKVKNGNSFGVPIHGLAFGLGADINLINSVSKISGGRSMTLEIIKLLVQLSILALKPI